MPQKNNSNAPSDIYLDVVLDSRIGTVGDIAPWNSATLERKHERGLWTLQALTQDLAWLFYIIQLMFQNEQNILCQKRNEYVSYTAELQKTAWTDFQRFAQDISLEKKNELKKWIINVLQYRFRIETALYASQLYYINCGEHASIAFVNELMRVKNGVWPKEMPLRMHRISLGKDCNFSSHRFLVTGSITLPETREISHDKQAIARILEKMDGMVIDYWNNPKAGGVYLPAQAAKEKFLMYSPKSSEVWDCMEIVEYSAIDMHSQIQDLEAESDVKEFLLKYAGPTLEEIQQAIMSTPNERKVSKINAATLMVLTCAASIVMSRYVFMAIENACRNNDDCNHVLKIISDGELFPVLYLMTTGVFLIVQSLKEVRSIYHSIHAFWNPPHAGEAIVAVTTQNKFEK